MTQTPLSSTATDRARIAVALLAALAALILFAAPAHAAGVAAADDSVLAVAITPLSRTDDARMTETVRSLVQNLREMARTHAEAGRHGEARQAYLSAAQLMREAGVLPVNEMHGAASSATAEGQSEVAAAMMDTLAADAAAFGVPLAQAQALLDAATQYGAAGRLETARDRLGAARLLMAWPNMPASSRPEEAPQVIAIR